MVTTRGSNFDANTYSRVSIQCTSTPSSPGRSKKSRAHAAEISFEQGCVWHIDRASVQPVIRECAQFPNGEYDDWVDTVTQAIIWLRKTYHLEFRDEDDEDEKKPQPERKPIYG